MARTSTPRRGPGGHGKTQLAVAFTHALWGARAVDALVGVPATSREAIITGFAQAAMTVGAAEAALSAETAADRFIGWLARTRRPWALILDDLVSWPTWRTSGPRARPARSSSPPAAGDRLPGPGLARPPVRRPGRGSPRSAGSAAVRCWRTWAPG